jgi:hypothetical protein
MNSAHVQGGPPGRGGDDDFSGDAAFGFTPQVLPQTLKPL